MAKNTTYRDKLNDTRKTKEALKFPLSVKSNGSLDVINDSISYEKQNLTNYLITSYGSRVMRPELGSPVVNLIGSQQTKEGYNRAAGIIENDINRKFEKIQVISVDVNEDTIKVSCRYTDYKKFKKNNNINGLDYNIIDIEIKI